MKRVGKHIKEVPDHLEVQQGIQDKYIVTCKRQPKFWI